MWTEIIVTQLDDEDQYNLLLENSIEYVYIE
jgi:hypothetical protein